jgi:hypothetical protein
VILIGLGLVLWWTAWLAWPASVVLILIGMARWLRARNLSGGAGLSD